MSLTSVLDQRISKRLFSLFDKEGTAVLDFVAFMNGLSSLFYGTLTERAQHYFSILDLDDSGDITMDEMKSILSIRGKRSNSREKEEDTVEQQLKKTMLILDADNDGEITRDGTIINII